MVGDAVEVTRDTVAATVVVVVVVVVAVAVAVGEIWTFPSGKAVEVPVETLRDIVAEVIEETLRATVAEGVIEEDVGSFVVIFVVIFVAAVAGILEVVETSAVVEEAFEVAATKVRESSSKYIVSTINKE